MVPCHVLAGGLPPFLIFSEALSSPSVYQYWYRPGCTSPTAEMGDYGAEEVERADPSPMAAWPRRPPARPRIRRQTGWRSAPPPLKGRSWLCRRFCSKPALGFGPMLWPPRPFLGGLTGVLARARGTWAGAFRSDATSGATGQPRCGIASKSTVRGMLPVSQPPLHLATLAIETLAHEHSLCERVWCGITSS